MNSKCRVQSKRRCESHESYVCFVGLSACGCQKKSVVYETEYRHVIDVGSAGGRGGGGGGDVAAVSRDRRYVECSGGQGRHR